MAERAPPPRPNPDPDPDPEPPAAAKPEAAPPAATYIVQVPKDTIYRVPPPENAYLAERYRQPQGRRRGCDSCCRCASWCLAPVALLALLFLGAAVAFYFMLKPALPEFSVEHVGVANSTRRHAHTATEYAVDVGVRNPSAGVGFSFLGGGSAVLLYKGDKVAAGKVVGFYLQAHGGTRTVALGLSGDAPQLPAKAGITLSLSMDFTVKMRLWGLDTSARDGHAGCSVGVSALGKQTRILHQSCQFKL